MELDFIFSTLFIEFYVGIFVARLLCGRKKYTNTSVVVGSLFALLSWIGEIFGIIQITEIDRLFRFGIQF